MTADIKRQGMQATSDRGGRFCTVTFPGLECLAEGRVDDWERITITSVCRCDGGSSSRYRLTIGVPGLERLPERRVNNVDTPILEGLS